MDPMKVSSRTVLGGALQEGVLLSESMMGNLSTLGEGSTLRDGLIRARIVDVGVSTISSPQLRAMTKQFA